jgi:hypothetical protein
LSPPDTIYSYSLRRVHVHSRNACYLRHVFPSVLI